MALKQLTMTSTFGCIATTQIATLSDADIASLTQAIVDDSKIYYQNPQTNNVTVQVGTIVVGTTTSSLSTMTSVALSSGPALTNNLIGSFVSGVGIQAGTTILSISGSGTNFTLTLSKAPNATFGLVGGFFIITQQAMAGWYARNGWLTIPGRGQLKVLPGDVIAVDPSGWPFIISYAAMTWPGTIWTLK